ncbi:hypothetical protein [Geobacter sp. AOG1]|nr:hypothetical protein [Geobacter sp. AOG1]
MKTHRVAGYAYQHVNSMYGCRALPLAGTATGMVLFQYLVLTQGVDP